MLARRAVARACSVFVGSAAVALGVLAVPPAYATTFGATSESPAAGAIVQPGAVTVSTPIRVCFDSAIAPLVSTLSLSAAKTGTVAGVTAPTTCVAGTDGLTFTPTTLPLPDDDYTASYSASDETVPTPQTASGSWKFRIDGTAPATPTISNIGTTSPILASNATTVSVDGTAEASHASNAGIDADPISVALTVHSPTGGSDVHASTTTDSNGSYTFTNVDVSGLTDSPSVTYTVAATDAAGNSSSAGTKTVVKDTSPATLSSSAPSDGGTHQPTSTVILTFSQPLDIGQSSATVSNGVGTELAETSTAFSVSNTTMTVTLVGTLGEAGNPYAASYTVHDVNGNLTTGTIHFTIDNTAPDAPTGLQVPNYVNLANVSGVSVGGHAEPGSSVSVTLSDGTHTATGSGTPAADGSFTIGSIDASGLDDGPAIAVSVTATDPAGNTSAPAIASMIKDTVAPAQPGAVTFPTTVNTANQAVAPISGSVAADVTAVDISVDDDNAATSPVTASLTPDAANNYSTTLDLSSLDDGSLTATVTAVDAAGNESAPQTATATKDAGVPLAPSVSISPKPYVNAAQAPNVTVGGTAEKSATVHVTVDDQDSGTPALTQDVTADSSTGAYTATFDVTSLTDGTLTATGTAEDAAHNVSAATTDTSTLDQQAPDTPSVTAPAFANSANAASYTVTGVAEPGSVVALTYTDSGTGHVVDSTTANGTSGDWSVSTDLTSLGEGALTVVVTATDAAGNVSSPDTEHPTKDTVAPSAPVVTAFTHPIDTTNDADVDVAGADSSAESGSTVAVSIDDDAAPATAPVTGSDVATGTGAYDVPSLDVTNLNDGNLTFSVTATDVAGNMSAATEVTAVKDTVALALSTRVPASSPTQSPAAIVLDYNEPVDPVTTTVVVTDNTSSAAAGSTTFSDGNRTVTFTPGSAFTELAGPYSVVADAHDPAADHDVTSFSFTVDNTPPGQPSVMSITDPINAANVDAVSIAGAAEPNSTVLVTVSDGTNHVDSPATADDSGAWSLAGQSLAGLADGTISATAVATDFAGNTSLPSTALTADKDTVVPAKPSVASLTNPVNANNVGAVAVAGVAEPNSSVSVTISDGTADVVLPATADGSGAWSLAGQSLAGLADGTISATAVATDFAGNSSPPSTALTALKDTVVPAKPSVGSLTNPINANNVGAVAVAGVAEPNSSVSVTITDGTADVVLPATADATGAWSVAGQSVAGLADGTISATAVATDDAANSSVSSTAMTALKDTVAPAKPVVSSVTQPVNAANASSVSVAGTAEPASAVHVDITDGAAHLNPSATTDGSGGWSIAGVDTTTLADGPLTITATAVDRAGNVSPASAASVVSKATVLPGTPGVRSLVPGDSSLAISWSAPTTGAAVSSYTVTVTPHNGGTASTFTTPDASTTTHAFTGLVNGTVYDVAVVADNSAGHSAAASGSATPRFVTTLTFGDTASRVIYGTRITLSGVLTRSDGQAVAGGTVRVFRTLDGGTAAVYRTLTTDATGHWSTSFAPAANASYFAGFIGDAGDSPATSAARRTTVAPRVTIRSPRNRSTSSAATALVVKGRVAPNKARRAVVLYYVARHGRLVRLAATRLSSTSTFALTTHLKRGTWRLRVVIGRSAGNVAGSSSTLTVKRT